MEGSLGEATEREQELLMAKRSLETRLEEAQRSLARLTQEHQELSASYQEEQQQKEQLKRAKSELEEQKRLLDRTTEKLNKEVGVPGCLRGCLPLQDPRPASCAAAPGPCATGWDLQGALAGLGEGSGTLGTDLVSLRSQLGPILPQRPGRLHETRLSPGIGIPRCPSAVLSPALPQAAPASTQCLLGVQGPPGCPGRAAPPAGMLLSPGGRSVPQPHAHGGVSSHRESRQRGAGRRVPCS